MTETKQIYTEPVVGLMTLGDVRGEADWRNYLALGFTEQHIPELCRMILDEELWWADSDNVEVWSAVHAWRVLAQLKAESAIPCLMTLLGRVDEYDDDLTSEELPSVFGQIGPSAIEPLRAFLADTTQGFWARVAAAYSLTEIGQRHPGSRAGCVAILSQQLAQFTQQEDNFNGLLIGYLVDLKGVEAAPVIEQAFAAHKVDLFLQGDWEDVQIYLGLLDKRITPPPDNRALMAAQMGFDPSEILKNLKRAIQAKLQRKAESKAVTQTKTKAKVKRKQAKQNRKKQRKRK